MGLGREGNYVYKGHKGGGVKEIIDYHGLLVDYRNFIQLLRTNMFPNL